MKTILTIFFLLSAWAGQAQVLVSGRILDKTKFNPVEGVQVHNNSGKKAVTDSLGKYSIVCSPGDSIYFYYNGKPTLKFAVASIQNPNEFELSLAVTVQPKYKTLKEVIVQAKSYKQDSLENRREYARYFNFQGGGVSTSLGAGGSAGLDLSVLNFKKNKQMKAFQNRLVAQEQEKYVDYKFNKKLINDLTKLEGDSLNLFIKFYRPNYYFISNADELTFMEYILKAAKIFRHYGIAPPAAKLNED